MSDNLIVSLGYSLSAFLFTILILIMYVGKKKYQTIDNSLYASLIYLTGFLTINETAFVFCLKSMKEVNLFAIIICKFYLCAVITWFLLFIYYVIFQLTNNYVEDKKNKKRNFYRTLFIIIGVILFAATCILPLEFFDYTNHAYVFGGNATYPAYVIGIVCILLTTYGFVFKYKDLSFKEKIPIIFALLFVIIMTYAESKGDSANHNSQSIQFITMLIALFFTIENQDNRLFKVHDEQRKEAENANKEQSEFLTSMSHEIRTPLGTIMGFSDVLIREGAKDEAVVKEDVNNIHNASIRLLDLITNILDLSRVESNKEEVNNKNFLVKDFIIDLNDNIVNKIDSSKVKFNIFVDENIPSQLFGDSNKIFKIIINLIESINRHTNNGTITLNLHNVVVNNEYKLEALITSVGSEVDIEDYKTYFDSSVNTVDSLKLGLNIAKHYSKMLNTEIKLTSEGRVNIGYSVDFRLNVIDNTPIGNISSLLNMNNISDNVNYQGKKILVVDDNRISINLLNRLLSGFNISFSSCTSGAECIELIQKENYDLIFLDHMMPDMDGITTLIKMKDLRSDLPPVIALTANSYPGAKDDYTNEGFSGYLPKPINKTELYRIVLNILK